MKKLFLVIILILTALAVQNLYCIDYYVSPSGDDNNTGTEALPFKTIQKAADVAVGGDIVYIREGIYNEHVILKNLNPEILYFSNYSQDSVTIDGTGFDVFWTGIVEIIGQSNIYIQGLKVINSNGTGIYCDSSVNITLTHNSTYNTASSGIAAWNTKNIYIGANKIDNACSNMSQECITVAGCDTFLTELNSITYCYKEGICTKDGSRNGIVWLNNVYNVINKLGIYVDAWDKHTFNITVRNNVVHNCNHGIVLASEMGGLLENIWVYNNVIYDNKFLGIDVSYNGDDTTVTYHPIKDVYIINNTVVKNGYEWGGGIANSNRDATNIIVRNNICSENLSFQIAHEGINPSNMTIDHNLINGFRWYPEEERGTDYVEADPMFVDTAAKDFHLKLTSPAIDAGAPEYASTFDFDKLIRPMGKGFDIGAYEYYFPDAVENDYSEKYNIDIHPNPFSDFCTIKTDSFSDIEIFDSFGRSIKKAKGQLDWKPERDYSDGVYYYTIRNGSIIKSGKIILLR